MNSFTHYWENETWDRDSHLEGKPLFQAASNVFTRRGVSVGDAVYVVTNKGGRVYLCGRMIVDRLVGREQARLEYAARGYGSEVWDAREHLLSDHATPMRFTRAIPEEILRQLHFGDGQPLAMDGAGRVDRQTLRAVRKLAPESAALLEAFLADSESGSPGRIAPMAAYSWKVLSDRVAVKQLDKSAFLHRGTGIPREIASFFDLPSGGLEVPRPVTLSLDGRVYQAHIQMDAVLNRFRLFWLGDFTAYLRTRFPQVYRIYDADQEPTVPTPRMRLERTGPDTFAVSFLYLPDPPEALNDSRESDSAALTSGVEGQPTRRYVTQYERRPELREAAVQFHGTTCCVCGFNFASTYGELGEGYVHIHHRQPVSELGGPMEVDPRTDLAPVCANCHAIIHRQRSKTVSIEELTVIVAARRVPQ